MPFLRKRRYGRRRFGMLRRRRRMPGRRPRRRFFRARRRMRWPTRTGPEWKKYVGEQTAIGCNHAFNAINLTSNIGLGTGVNQRIGSKIIVRKIELWYNITSNTTVAQQTARLVVWRLKNTIADAPASVQQIFDTCNGAIPTTQAIGTGKVGHNHNYRVLYKRGHRINPFANAAQANPQGQWVVSRYVALRWRRGLRVVYSDGVDVPGLNKCNQIQADMFGTDWLGTAPEIQPVGNLYWAVWFNDA